GPARGAAGGRVVARLTVVDDPVAAARAGAVDVAAVAVAGVAVVALLAGIGPAVAACGSPTRPVAQPAAEGAGYGVSRVALLGAFAGPGVTCGVAAHETVAADRHPTRARARVIVGVVRSVVARLAVVDHPIAAVGEATVQATGAGRRVGVLVAVIALLPR